MARILIIDDEETLREQLRENMLEAGFDVLLADSGREALSLTGEPGPGSIDLVITDILMPDGNGLELIQALQERFPNIKAIAISGGDRFARFGLGEAFATARGLGALRVLQKPFTMTQLLDAVRKLLAA